MIIAIKANKMPKKLVLRKTDIKSSESASSSMSESDDSCILSDDSAIDIESSSVSDSVDESYSESVLQQKRHSPAPAPSHSYMTRQNTKMNKKTIPNLPTSTKRKEPSYVPKKSKKSSKRSKKESEESVSEQASEQASESESVLSSEQNVSMSKFISIFPNLSRAMRLGSSNITSDAAYLNIMEKCEQEEWYKRADRAEQREYSKIVVNLLQPDVPIPTMQDILLLNTDKNTIKSLISHLFIIHEMDKLDVEYLSTISSLCDKIKRYSNSNEEEKRKKNIETEKEIAKILNEKSVRTLSLHERILASPLSTEIKSILIGRYYPNVKNKGEEGGKYAQYINTVLSLPTKTARPRTDANLHPNLSLARLTNTLFAEINRQIYGMKNIKEETICTIANMIVNPSAKLKAFGMVGPPGVGKTLLAHIISKTSGLPMEMISLGGITDSASLVGHDFTYMGGMPGLIVRSIIKMKHTNGIIFMDEIDKISQTAKGKEVQDCLLHITDFTQNHKFHDKYIGEIPIDLSNYIFIYSMNSIHGMDPTLLNRIPLIEVEGYTNKEKIKISQDYLIPQLLKDYNLTASDIIFTPDIIQKIIQMAPEEYIHDGKSGVRRLKNTINKIINRISFLINTTVTPDMKGYDAEIDKTMLDLSFRQTENPIVLPFVVPETMVKTIIQNDKAKPSTKNLSCYS